MKNKLSLFSSGVAVDLGSSNILIYIKGRGIVLNEPSIIALNKKTKEILAVGQKAKDMIGRTPEHLMVTHPVIGSVISDFELAEEMLRIFFGQAKKNYSGIMSFRPKVIATVPCGTTDVERKAVEDVLLTAGASSVFLIEEPIAAAVGARLPVFEPTGNIIIDIGGGTSEIAVISLGGVVKSKSLKIGGNKFNEDIIKYIKDEYHLIIGDPTAEVIKKEIGSVKSLNDKSLKISVRGRDSSSGLPNEITISNDEIVHAFEKSIEALAQSISSVIEETPPELLADIYNRNIWLSGGGSLLRGMDEFISENCGLDVVQVDDPITSSVRGAGFILENFDKYKKLLIRDE